ncbi:cell division protein ZapA [Lysobacter xinjiangensis]|jgi:cell division protein ZapA|uniref:Cell division protein ZapA n=1 Tax=Cognatilysobacter xinjiangensis TaxID=546892 RepID=A0ABQ3C3W9_9GAMM|nr:cell division protein ZapA [Lysobacter xinjiangensis]GGZ67173.1 cell division protein ZapA [Lysobacter xinjiangensis]
MSTSEPVNVRLLDREYTVGCTPEQRDGLLAAAKLLDNKMREIRGSNRMAAVDRIAVLAALNIAHEFLQVRPDTHRERDIAHSLGMLNRRLDDLLEQSSG